MPIVTSAPVLVDTVNFSRQASNEINPYEGVFGTDLYQVFIVDPIIGHVARIGVFLSTDGGSSWTEQDSSNSPNQGNVSKFTVFFEPSTNSIHIFYQVNDPQRIVTFDTVSKTYGTPTVAASNTLNPQGNARNFFYRKSNGDFVIIAGGFGTFGDEIAYFTNIAGTWSTATSFITGVTNAIVVGGIMDSADAAHFGYLTGGNVVTARLSSGFAVTTPVVHGSTATVNPGDRLSFALYSTDSVVLGWVGNLAGSDLINFSIGTPLSNPIFTDSTLDSSGGGKNVTYPTAGVNPSGELQGFWIETDFSGSPIDQMWRSIFNGATWGTPEIFYDEIANPPDNSPPDPTNQFLHTGDVVYLPSGITVFATTMERIESSINFCTGYALLTEVTPPTPQTLTLIKIVNGGPAAPSDFTLTAVGGSPETEITGPGPQVGPTDVNAGIFELFESDPGGATWDGPNAKWDSPTFLWDGSGQYRPVWDCNGAPMPTPTSVVVSPGGGGAIPLGVTQVPDVDPTFAPLLSNGPFEFLVGGFFYQVLWNSGGRLGMFRRQASVGGSFTEIDATNAPTGISGYGRATLRGTIIAVCYMLPGLTTVKIVEFNTVSSGWGIPTAALTLLATTATFAFEKRSDGTYVFVAGRPNVVYYATNTGGAWSGTHILLTLGSGIVVLGGVIDSADRIWLLLNTNSTTVGLYALSSSYTLGSSVATSTLLFPGPPYPYIYYPQVALWGADAVAVAYNTALTIGGAGVIRVKIGVGLSSPTFTSYDVYTVPAGTEQDYLMHPRDDGSGNLNLFFVHTNTGVLQVKQSTFDGASTWNTPSTFYDAVTNPPFAGSASQAISTIDPVPSNGWAVGAAMQTDQPTEITTAEIIQESSGGGSSDVVCTVINYFTGPAPAPPGPGQMNPVGCFELLRVDATLMPARHLPVRGSTR